MQKIRNLSFQVTKFLKNLLFIFAVTILYGEFLELLEFLE